MQSAFTSYSSCSASDTHALLRGPPPYLRPQNPALFQYGTAIRDQHDFGEHSKRCRQHHCTTPHLFYACHLSLLWQELCWLTSSPAATQKQVLLKWITPCCSWATATSHAATSHLTLCYPLSCRLDTSNLCNSAGVFGRQLRVSICGTCITHLLHTVSAVTSTSLRLCRPAMLCSRHHRQEDPPGFGALVHDVEALVEDCRARCRAVSLPTVAGVGFSSTPADFHERTGWAAMAGFSSLPSTSDRNRSSLRCASLSAPSIQGPPAWQAASLLRVPSRHEQRVTGPNLVPRRRSSAPSTTMSRVSEAAGGPLTAVKHTRQAENMLLSR